MPSRILNYIDLLPEEILTDNIFTRLPVKLVGQCKCVSKPWNSLISDPRFVKTHLTTTCNDDKLIFISRNHFHSVSWVNNPEWIGSHLKFDCSDTWSKLWGSCDGLVLAQAQARTSMYLLNPTTLESKQLPVLPSLRTKDRNDVYMFGFGYDSIADDYAAVAISYRPISSSKVARVYVYMLKKNYWDRVGFSPYDHRFCGDGTVGMFVEGCLHWLVKNVDDSSWLISAFAISTKKFSQVPFPGDLGPSLLRRQRLGVLKGCLCLINTSQSTMIRELWVMKKYGVVESWIKISVDISKFYYHLQQQENNLVEMDHGQFVMIGTNEQEATPNEEEAKPYKCNKVIVCHGIYEAGRTYVESLVSCNNKNAHQKEKRGRRTKTIK